MVEVALRTLEHRGMCDASAAIPLDNNHFLVASDEDSYLRVYKAHTSGGPVTDPISVHDWLGLQEPLSESEIEAASQLNGVTYWISSHGRNSKGKLKLDRHHFFGTRVKWDAGKLEVELVGQAYHNLLSDLLLRTELSEYTTEQLQDEKIANLAPKKERAVNIEGLCTHKDGLLIGFRNPVPDGKALVIRFKNPLAVIEDGETARFAKPIFLDLGGLGVRSIEYFQALDCFLIIAGSFESGGQFALYKWSGARNEAPVRLFDLEGLNPESVVIYPDNARVQILSDNGADRNNETGSPCKDLPADSPRKHFTSVWLDV